MKPDGKPGKFSQAKVQTEERTGRPQRRAERGLPEVRVWFEDVVLPTYLPALPDKNPMFLEKRVYQGSSGRVYPLPFTDRIAETPVDRVWKGVWIENEYLRALVLPEIGGRIHVLQDKTNGYDLIYNQAVIKPALVGLAGPWISGGIEFNWPQHHRPATFLPVDVEVEGEADGSQTIWCSDHDPMARMKGMHGVCLRPGKAYLELKVRAYNRTPWVQTFLWWVNVATRVHESYQSFFPPDVYYVADHARRSMSEYPLAQGIYYGVNYGERGRRGIPDTEVPPQFVPPHCGGERRYPALLPRYAPNDLSFYANIPTPCSYMCMGSKENFFGGYDYAAEAGIVHIANHHISPGKKQWTWGNHQFGYAWDRNLTEPDSRGEYGPYIEIMAGVYTDNQPDFSFLQPGETKSWSQFWYPIQKIGPVCQANVDAAISVRKSSKPGVVSVGIVVTRTLAGAVIGVSRAGKDLLRIRRDLVPGSPLLTEVALRGRGSEQPLRIEVRHEARNLIACTWGPRQKGKVPPPATELPPPSRIRSSDELYVAGLHLEQYRHATRCPTLYWREALRRDPGDARCNNALGLWHLRRGELTLAEDHFRQAVARLTQRNANPYDGEPFYNLGLCLRQTCRDGEAYDYLYKATWNLGWAAPAYHALAEIDCCRNDWGLAREHLDRCLRLNADNLRARNLKTLVLRQLRDDQGAEECLAQTRGLDRLDWWARHIAGEKVCCDLQTRLDIAHDYARAGFLAQAVEILREAKTQKRRDLPDQSWGALPLVHYTAGWLEARRGRTAAARKWFRRAARGPVDYCFPARLEEISILGAAIRDNPKDGRALYLLGNLLYDRRRHGEAIKAWERSARLEPGFSVVWRNLGIGHFNTKREGSKARMAYDKAFRANQADARVLYERDQLWKRLGESPVQRLRELERHGALVQQRDDLTIELCALYNQTGQHTKAVDLLSSRRFQPWEGGEGGPLGQHVRAHLALGRQALADGSAGEAKAHFESALVAPGNVGEAKHLLANQSEIQYWLGLALAATGQAAAAREQWTAAANFRGDFQDMSVRAFSDKTFYAALSWRQLGEEQKAKCLLRELLNHARALEKADTAIDYFATSLPTMLIFDDDPQARQKTAALFLQGQAQLGLGKTDTARRLLLAVLQRDPNHALASDLLAELPD